MSLVIKLPFGCPKCEKSHKSKFFLRWQSKADRYPAVKVELERETDRFKNPDGYSVKGFICPGCGWGGRKDDDPITVHTTKSEADSTLFFSEEYHRDYYYLGRCHECNAQHAQPTHASLVEDYFDYYAKNEYSCRACSDDVVAAPSGCSNLGWSIQAEFSFIHPGYDVTWVDLSADHSRGLLSVTESTRLWDTFSGEEIARFDNRRLAAPRPTFSNSGNRFLLEMGGGRVGLLDGKDARCLTVLDGHEGDVDTHYFSPDDRYILTSSRDNKTRLWDAETGRQINVLTGRGVFDGSGQRILARAQQVGVWHRDSGDFLWSEDVNDAPSYFDAFSPDGKRVLVKTGNLVQLLDAEDGTLAFEFKYKGDLYAAVFSPDASRIVMMDEEETILWNTESGQKIATLGDGLEGVGEASEPTKFHGVFSLDSGRMISQSVGNAFARVSCARTGRELAQLSEPGSRRLDSAALSSDGKQAITTAGSCAILWDVDSARQIARLSEPANTDDLSIVRLYCDDKILLTHANGKSYKDDWRETVVIWREG
jgi:WD40 repeat protein